MKTKFAVVMMFVAVLFCPAPARGQIYIPTNDPPYYGPYNGAFLAGGDELQKHLLKNDTVLRADSPWSFYALIWVDEAPEGPGLSAGGGEASQESSRCLGGGG